MESTEYGLGKEAYWDDKDTYIHGSMKFFKSITSEDKVFTSMLKALKDTPLTFVLVFDFPKRDFLAKKWPRQIEMAPDEWEKDERYKFLNPDGKHDFHIVCKDGVFYTNRQDLIRILEYFKEKFETEWKDKAEIKLDVSVETMRIIATYLFTNTFLAPTKITPEGIAEIAEWIDFDRFNLPSEKYYNFRNDLDVYVCRQLCDASLSLYDLISWWKIPFLFRLRDTVELKMEMGYYNEVTTEYKADATFTDNENKKIHEVLHQRYFKTSAVKQSLLDRIAEIHDMKLKTVVAEVTQKKK